MCLFKVEVQGEKKGGDHRASGTSYFPPKKQDSQL